MDRITGVIPPMITPFSERGDVDYGAFAANIHKWNESRLAGYLVIGSNSETVYLSEEEKLRLVEITAENAAPGRIVMAGTGLESARETIALTNKCARRGAQAALVLTPFYYGDAMNAKALIRYFSAVADASDIPILIYNVTKYTRVNIPAAAVEELSRHPNIVGMKDSNGDVPQLATFLRVADESFQVMTGTFGAWYPALCMGITATVSAMANCAPDPVAAVQELYDGGKPGEAYALWQRWFPVNAAVTGAFGIPGLKYAATRMGYDGGHVRNPLADLADSDKAALDAILDKAIRRPQ